MVDISRSASKEALQIAAACGAEEAVQFCGGVASIMTAAGVNMEGARTQAGELFCSQADISAVTAVYMSLETYEDVKAKLTNRARLKLALVDRDGLIPDASLAAIRQVLLEINRKHSSFFRS